MTTAQTVAGKEEGRARVIVRTPRSIARVRLVFAGLWAALILLTVFSLLYGRYALPWQAWWQVLTKPSDSGMAGIVLLEVRLPRILADS